ncbi:MAG: NAD(P)/FAD-dependent oxidoreductase [Flavisolibacter sp.]
MIDQFSGMDSDRFTDTLILGASAAGLSCAACLKKHQIPFLILEQNPTVGEEWTNRYDRLHLHTPKTFSHLPYFKIPKKYDKYLSKNTFADYLKQYAEWFNIQPLFNRKITRVEHMKGGWEVATTDGTYRSKNIIVATGYSRKPLKPQWPGLERFTGEIIHSSEYRNGKPFKNKKILIIGMGNSGGEIAIDLLEHGAIPSISVRNGVNIIPRDIAGLSILNVVQVLSWIGKLSTSLADGLNKPILSLIYGNYKKYGLKKLPYGPITQVIKYQKIPLLDIGTVRGIKKGLIRIYPGIDQFRANQVYFTDGRAEEYDVVIMATGYEPALNDFLQKEDIFPGKPVKDKYENIKESGFLFYCGFRLSANGMIHEIGLEAKKIAKVIAKLSRQTD